MDRILIDVNGMVNNQSKTVIKNALSHIDGVNMVNVDLVHGSVEIGYNLPANKDELRACIENAGYFIG